MIVVRKSKGYWRVYRVTKVNEGRTITTQLVKFHKQEAAELVADFHRKRDQRNQERHHD